VSIVGPVTVAFSHLRHPLWIGGFVCYQLVTDAGEFVASIAPDIYDNQGQLIALSGETAAGSTVRLSLSPNDALLAVQIVAGRFEHPFAK
jgi:hypothetical protein